MTDFPDLKMKALVNFPASAIGRTGIDVVKSNGQFFVDLDFGDFAPPISSFPPADIPNLNGLLWNVVTGRYVLAPLTLIGSGGAGISEAPLDGFSYGRNSAAWQKVLGLGGGTLTGELILAADPVSALDAATKQYVDQHAASLTFETRADAMAALISPTAASITIRRYSSGDRRGDAPYTRGTGLLSFNDANGQPWQLDPSVAVFKASWWGINGVRSPTYVDETAKLQALANASQGYAVEIDSLIALSSFVSWPSNVTVFGRNNLAHGFIAMPGYEFYDGLAYVNNKSWVRFLRLAFRGNLVQPAIDGYHCGAIFIAADLGGPGMDEFEVSDCRFENFKHAEWIYVVVSGGVNPQYIHMLKVLRNEVYASSACAVTPGASKAGNYFLRVTGGTVVDEPSTLGVVSNIVFAQNQISAPGLNGVYEGLFNQGNIICSQNVSEFLGEYNQDQENKCYAYAFYNSHPEWIDPYHIAFVGNVVSEGMNCGVYAAGCRHITVTGSVFRNIRTTTGAILISGCSGFAIASNGGRNISVTGNSIVDCPGGIWVGQDVTYQSTDVVTGNSVSCVGDVNRPGTGIYVVAGSGGTSADKFSTALVGNNNVNVVGGASARGIQINALTTVGHVKIVGNDVRSEGVGISGQGVVGTLFELIGNSVHGALLNYPYLFSTTAPLVVKDELVDWSDTVAGSSSGVSFDSCTNLMIDGFTLLNKTNSLGAFSAAGSQGTLEGISFRNCATQVVAGGTQLGQIKPTFAAAIGNRVQNLVPVVTGTPNYYVDHWINLSGSTTWLEARQATG
jgi:hypothetical protein